MTGRERVLAIFDRKVTDRVGFWKGNPNVDIISEYGKYFNVEPTEVNLSEAFNDDMVWLMAEEHLGLTDIFRVRGGHGQTSLMSEKIFAKCTSVEEIEAYDWPDVNDLDFTEYEKVIDKAIENNLAVCGGLWSPFFHDLADFFGMENYFIKMYTDEEVVLAVTQKVVDFYVEANNNLFKALGDKIDIFLFGNDFGTQNDLLISPSAFEKFILPGFKKLVDVGKNHNKKVLLHSCGAISRVIPMLIDAGIDGLHPLQAKAKGMNPENLIQFKDDIIFVGGVDTQDLLPNGTPRQIKNEVKRLKEVFGPGFILSPSHESLMADVPIENVLAMRDEALK